VAEPHPVAANPISVDMANFILRGIALLFGLFTAFLAIGLYEGDEKRLCDRLSEIWIRIEDAKESAMTRQAAFVRESAQSVSRALTRVFGLRLFAGSAVGVSICWSATSLFATLSVFITAVSVYVAIESGMQFGAMGPWIALELLVVVVGAAISIHVGALPYRRQWNRPPVGWWSACGAVAGFSSALLIFYVGGIRFSTTMQRLDSVARQCPIAGFDASRDMPRVFQSAESLRALGRVLDQARPTTAAEASRLRAQSDSLRHAYARLDSAARLCGAVDSRVKPDAIQTLTAPGTIRDGLFLFVLVLAGAVLSDFLMIALTRWSLHRMAQQERFAPMLFLLLGNLVGAAITIGLPIAIARHAWSTQQQLVAIGSSFVAASNALTALLSLLSIMLCLVLLLHRAAWPLISRLVYALDRYGVIRQKKLLGSLSAMSLIVAVPAWSGIVTSIRTLLLG